jgi:hypothetical protein
MDLKKSKNTGVIIASMESKFSQRTAFDFPSMIDKEYTMFTP